jgi:hypothetical protein
MFTTSLIISAVYFCKHPEEFKMDYFIPGTIGSGLNVIGCLFMNTAVSTGQPLGPMFALQMSQSLMVLVWESFTRLDMPNLMQAGGFVIGIIGGLILMVPDAMEYYWRRLTCKSQ